MKRILPLAFLLAALEAGAQQEPQFTHFTWNRFVYNPAVAGSENELCATLLYRNQWARFSGPDLERAPVTKTFSFHAPLFGVLGTGMHVVSDKEGFISTTGAYISNAYHLTLPFGARLGIGISTGFIQKAIDPKWRAADANDPRLPGTSSSAEFDAGAGVYLLGRNWYIGASSLHLPQRKFAWKTPSGRINYEQKASYWLVAGYEYAGLMNGRLRLQPAALVKTDLAMTAFAANLQGVYNEFFIAAVNYRAERITALNFMAGLYIFDDLAATCSVDVPTGSASVFGGSQELMVQYTPDLCDIIICDFEDVWNKTPRFL